MTPSSDPPLPQRTAAANPVRALFAALALLTLPQLALAWESTMDPVFVFYPRESCTGERIALEVWKRDEQRWARHPRHPVIPVDSCQLEDAGVLLNEIRWRCLDRGRSDLDSGWSLGVRVFEPSVMQRCDVVRTGGGFGETEIHVSTPKPGETISDADGNLEIEGSVWIGGLAGAEYDIVIAIDTSAESPLAQASRPNAPRTDTLAAQVRAAREFVETIQDRLGEVRVGIVSHPGTGAKSARRSGNARGAPSNGDSETLRARRELPLTDDAAAIQRALTRISRRNRTGTMSFSDGLSLAIDELFRPPDWPGAARPGARRIVMLSGSRSAGFPKRHRPSSTK